VKKFFGRLLFFVLVIAPLGYWLIHDPDSFMHTIGGIVGAIAVTVGGWFKTAGEWLARNLPHSTST
jgi:hypothetical protein